MKIFLFLAFVLAASVEPALASIEADMSGCNPFQRNVQGSALDFQIDSGGNLVFKNSDPLIKSSKKTKSADSYRKKLLGQSGHAQITLTRTADGYPSRVEVIEPRYDSNKPSETLTFSLAYREGRDGKKQCFINEYQIYQYDGQYKGKTFIYYNNDLCNELENALDAKTDDLIKRCAPVIGNLQALINEKRTAYKKENKDLYQYIDSKEDGSSSLARIINTLGDCRNTRRDLFPHFKYPAPGHKKGFFLPGVHIRPADPFEQGTNGAGKDTR